MLSPVEAQQAATLAKCCNDVPRLKRWLLASFRNLDKHKQRGTYDRFEAVRLLAGNVRDACRMRGEEASLAVRDRAAKLLLAQWQTHTQPE